MSRFTGRGKRTRRIMRAAAGAGLRRLVRQSPQDDRRLGEALVAELRARLIEECDYTAEATQLAFFAEGFSGVPGVILPRAVPGRCAQTVLTTTWCQGLSLYDFVESATVEARQRTAQTLARFAWRSLFGLHRINADPHPGNYRMREDGVVFLDFGCVRVFSPGVVDNERRLIRAVLDGNTAAFREATLASGMVPDPRRFDFALHQEFCAHLWRPCCQPGFVFDQAYFAEAQRFSGPGNPNLRRMAIPPWWIWLQRLHWGLLSVIGKLGVPVDLSGVLEACLEMDRGH